MRTLLQKLFSSYSLAIDFQRRAQRPSGLVDLCTTNWESAPDTGFTVQLLAPIVALSRKKGAEGDQRAAEIAEALGDYVRTAALGMIVRSTWTGWITNRLNPNRQMFPRHFYRMV